MFTLITPEIIDQIEAFCLNCITQEKTKRYKRCLQRYGVTTLDSFKYRKDGHEFDSFHYWDLMKTMIGTGENKAVLKSYLWDNYLIQFFRYSFGQNLRLPFWQEKLNFLRAIANEDESSHGLEMPWVIGYIESSVEKITEKFPSIDRALAYYEKNRMFYDNEREAIDHRNLSIKLELNERLLPSIREARGRIKIYKNLITPQPKTTDVALGGDTPRPREGDMMLSPRMLK